MKSETHTEVKSPIFAISFHVSGSTPLYMPLLLTTMMTTGRLYLLKRDHTEFRNSTVVRVSIIQQWCTHLHMVSTSMPEKPKALSPSTQTILWPLPLLLFSNAAAAIAKPRPTPIVPNVPASNLQCVTCFLLYNMFQS